MQEATDVYYREYIGARAKRNADQETGREKERVRSYRRLSLIWDILRETVALEIPVSRSISP